MENLFGPRDYRLEVDGDGLEGLGATEGGVETGSQRDEETRNEMDNQWGSGDGAANKLEEDGGSFTLG